MIVCNGNRLFSLYNYYNFLKNVSLEYMFLQTVLGICSIEQVNRLLS